MIPLLIDRTVRAGVSEGMPYRTGVCKRAAGLFIMDASTG